jgi:hypothetical protein
MKSTLLLFCLIILLISPAFAQDMQYVSAKNGDTLFVKDDADFGGGNTLRNLMVSDSLAPATRVYFLKAAIERARTTDPQKLIRAIESEPLAWETPEGWKIMRKEDHSVAEDVVWGETMFSDTYGFAILKNLQAIQAEQICRTPEELKAVRDNYEKRMKEAKK